MKKLFVVGIVSVLTAGVGEAQEWAKARLNNSPRHGEWVEYKSGERTLKGFADPINFVRLLP